MLRRMVLSDWPGKTVGVGRVKQGNVLPFRYLALNKNYSDIKLELHDIQSNRGRLQKALKCVKVNPRVHGMLLSVVRRPISGIVHLGAPWRLVPRSLCSQLNQSTPGQSHR